MKTLLIVSHAPSEHTRAMTRSVIEGASHVDICGIDVRLVPALEQCEELGMTLSAGLEVGIF